MLSSFAKENRHDSSNATRKRVLALGKTTNNRIPIFRIGKAVINQPTSLHATPTFKLDQEGKIQFRKQVLVKGRDLLKHIKSGEVYPLVNQCQIMVEDSEDVLAVIAMHHHVDLDCNFTPEQKQIIRTCVNYSFLTDANILNQLAPLKIAIKLIQMMEKDLIDQGYEPLSYFSGSYTV